MKKLTYVRCNFLKVVPLEKTEESYIYSTDSNKGKLMKPSAAYSVLFMLVQSETHFL